MLRHTLSTILSRQIGTTLSNNLCPIIILAIYAH